MPLISLIAAAATSLVATFQGAGPAVSEGPMSGSRASRAEASIISPGTTLARNHNGSMHYDETAGGVHWARGHGYKASAGPDGFAFIPFLGSNAPQNFPVRFELAEVVSGATVVRLDSATEVARVGDRILFDHGRVEVRYDLTSESVEQSFAISSLEVGGDLVLTLSVETELDVQKVDGGFRFFNRLGGMDYGAAFAFDSNGMTTPVPASWVDGSIELTVPAEFVRAASFPIVVDPLLDAFTVGTAVAGLGNPDVSHDKSDGRFVVVAEERFSATDTDILTWRVDADGTVSDEAYVEQTAANWTQPRVVVQYTGTADSQFVATADSLAIPGSTDIVWRQRGGDLVFGPPAILRSASASFGCSDPDIGTDGVFFGAGVPYAVAYLRNYGSHRDVHTMLLGGATVFSDSQLSSGPSHDASSPAISETSGNDGAATNYVVGWEERELSTGASSVRAALFGYQGGVNGMLLVAGPTNGVVYSDVDVSKRTPVSLSSGSGSTFLVTFDDEPSNDTDAFVAVCSGTSVFATYELQRVEHAAVAPDQSDVRIIADPDGFTLGYEEGGQLHVTSFNLLDGNIGIVERRRVAVGSDVRSGSLAASGRATSSGTDSGGLFVWAQNGAAAPEIAAAVIDPTVPALEAAGWQFCFGSANSTGDRGFIQALGNRVAGQSQVLRVEALPPNAFGYYLTSTSVGFIPGAFGSQGVLCLGGDIGGFGVFQANAAGVSSGQVDTSQLAQPMGPIPAMAGERWNFQSWYRDANGGTATSNWTNGVSILFR